MRRRAALGGKLDGLGRADVPLVDLHGGRLAQNRHLSGREVHEDHRARLGRARGREDRAAAGNGHAGDVGVPRRDIPDAAGLDADPCEVRDAARGVCGEDAPGRFEVVARPAEDPLCAGKLRVHRRDRLHLGAVLAMEVPPAAPVRDEVKRPVRRPGGLDDRLIRAAGHLRAAVEPPVRAHGRGPELRAVPRHVREVPLHPSERAAVRREPRRRVEVAAAREPPDLSPAERHLRDRVRRLPAARVVLHDGDEPIVRLVKDEVREAKPLFSGHRFRLASGPHAIEALVGEVREVHRAVGERQVRGAAVLMDARAGIERRRVDVGRPAVGRPAHDDVAAALLRAHLEPVDVLAGEARLHEADGPGDDEVGGDGRFPSAVRGDLLRCHALGSPWAAFREGVFCVKSTADARQLTASGTHMLPRHSTGGMGGLRGLKGRASSARARLSPTRPRPRRPLPPRRARGGSGRARLRGG